jgi:dTDP-4-amino-4,6-dideoxygalactose transaminase
VHRVLVAPGCESSRHLYQVLVEGRDQVIVELNEQQIYPGVHYRDNTLYKMYRYAEGTCLRSMYASERVLSLPMHLRMSRADAARVTDALKQTLNIGGQLVSLQTATPEKI